MFLTFVNYLNFLIETDFFSIFINFTKGSEQKRHGATLKLLCFDVTKIAIKFLFDLKKNNKF